MNLEHALYDVSARLARAEDSNGAMNSRIQGLNEGMSRCYQVRYALAFALHDPC